MDPSQSSSYFLVYSLVLAHVLSFIILSFHLQTEMGGSLRCAIVVVVIHSFSDVLRNDSFEDFDFYLLLQRLDFLRFNCFLLMHVSYPAWTKPYSN